MSKSFLNKPGAKFMIGGGALVGTGIVIDFFTLLSAYQKVGDCLDITSPCGNVSVEQIATKVAIVMIITGLGVFGLGIWQLIKNHLKSR